MTQTKLNETLDISLVEHPDCGKPNKHSRKCRRENRNRKNDKLLKIITLKYIPHAGYVDADFEGRTLLHSGKYIKYPKNSNPQRFMKRQTAKRARRYNDYPSKGNQYRRLLDFWWILY